MGRPRYDEDAAVKPAEIDRFTDYRYYRAVTDLDGEYRGENVEIKGNHQMKGYFDYVVPLLEGFWWQDGLSGVDYAYKEDFNFLP